MRHLRFAFGHSVRIYDISDSHMGDSIWIYDISDSLYAMSTITSVMFNFIVATSNWLYAMSMLRYAISDSIYALSE